MALAPPERAPRSLIPAWRRPAVLGPSSGRTRLDRVELSLLILVGAVSLWLVGVDVVSAAVHHRVWTGTDGLYLPDQLQYTAWIRDASKHVLISDLYVLKGTPHDYLQPAIAISGGLTALGMAPWLSLLLWKPVAVLGLFFAVRAYCRRMLPGRSAQHAALALALFYGFFGTYPAVDESFPFLTWGYPFTVIAAAALVGSLVAYAKAREQRRLTWAAPALGLLASWMHPWQGEVLILVVIGGELLAWDRSRRWLERLVAPGLTIAATAVPLAYYAALDHFDPVWRLGRVATLTEHWGLVNTVGPLLPLVLAAALAYRFRPRTFLDAATRVWPLAMLVVFELSKGAFAATPLHALTGATIPLAVMAVQGLQVVGLGRLKRARLLGALAVAALTIPGTVYMMNHVRSAQAPATNGMNFISRDEHRALNYLRGDPQPGGVLTDFVLGAVVPGATGRHTYIGDCDWSVPHCNWRFSNTWETFLWRWTWKPGHWRGWFVRWLVHRSGARFVLESCHGHVWNFEQQLRPLLVAVHHFGCATVYQVRAGHRYLI